MFETVGSSDEQYQLKPFAFFQFHRFCERGVLKPHHVCTAQDWPLYYNITSKSYPALPGSKSSKRK